MCRTYQHQSIKCNHLVEKLTMPCPLQGNCPLPEVTRVIKTGTFCSKCLLNGYLTCLEKYSPESMGPNLDETSFIEDVITRAKFLLDLSNTEPLPSTMAMKDELWVAGTCHLLGWYLVWKRWTFTAGVDLPTVEELNLLIKIQQSIFRATAIKMDIFLTKAEDNKDYLRQFRLQPQYRHTILNPIDFEDVGVEATHSRKCSFCERDFRTPSTSDDESSEETVRHRWCNKVFGKKCLEDWVLEREECPYCQGPLIVDKFEIPVPSIPDSGLPPLWIALLRENTEFEFRQHCICAI